MFSKLYLPQHPPCPPSPLLGGVLEHDFFTAPSSVLTKLSCNLWNISIC